MGIIYTAIVILAIVLSVCVVIGYVYGFNRGVYVGVDEGFEFGASESLKRTLQIMDNNGLFVSYCDALKNEARRCGMSDDQIKRLVAEQEEMLSSLQCRN